MIVRSAIDPSIDLYYAAGNDGKLYAGASGANWQNVFAHPNGETISDVRVDPADPTTVYVAFGGTGTGRVYRLKRSSPAPASMTAVDITSDLPSGLTIGRVVGSASGGALAVDRLQPLTIYVGTNRGVYCGRTSDGGNTWYWTLYDNGMPEADVADLEVHPTTGVMRAATYGRAVYEVNTDYPLGSLVGVDGKVTLLRVHDLGTGYGLADRLHRCGSRGLARQHARQSVRLPITQQRLQGFAQRHVKAITRRVQKQSPSTPRLCAHGISERNHRASLDPLSSGLVRKEHADETLGIAVTVGCSLQSWQLQHRHR